MRSHHCWKWGPEPQYHQRIWWCMWSCERTHSHVCRESRAGDSGHNPVGLLRSGWWCLRWTGLLSPLEVCRWGNLGSSHRVKSLGRGLWVLKLSWWGLLYWKLSYSQWIAVLHSSHFCCQCVWGNSTNTVHRAPFVRFKSATCFDHLTIPFPKFLKVNFLYWHRWFNKERLISMEPFHSTKCSILGKVLW